jgi:hypothetical protein
LQFEFSCGAIVALAVQTSALILSAVQFEPKFEAKFEAKFQAKFQGKFKAKFDAQAGPARLAFRSGGKGGHPNIDAMGQGTQGGAAS